MLTTSFKHERCVKMGKESVGVSYNIDMDEEKRKIFVEVVRRDTISHTDKPVPENTANTTRTEK